VPVTRLVAMSYGDWMSAAQEEYHRLDALLRDLDPLEWSRPTACDEWDVRALAAHLVGAADCAASLREMMRQAYRGRRLRADGDLVDKINAVQVVERAGRTPEALVDDLRVSAGRAVRARSRIPSPLLKLPLPFGSPLGTRPLGYLMGRIYTRDAWMHRMDICGATGRVPVLTGHHDARIVDDIVIEWATRHGRPYSLTLTGPAGGTWSTTEEGEPLTLDAVEFCRVVSGREAGAGLLATTVPF
jgi:uncharacterized protein (TIGR03083 family)